MQKRSKKRIKLAAAIPEPVICSEAEARLATAKRDLYEAIQNDEPESLIIVYRKHGEIQGIFSTHTPSYSARTSFISTPLQQRK